MTAPGKAHREGISLIELFQLFPDDAAAERWFEKARWGTAGKPSHCPLCGSVEKLGQNRDRKPLPYWCGGCRQHFSVRSGTVMHRSRIPLQKWAIGIYLWSTSLKGVSSMKLHRDLNITQKSAYFMAQRLREAWSGTGGRFIGPVEADETYVGGRRKNKPKRQRPTAMRTGIVGKAIVAGVRDRATNRVSAAVVPDTKRQTLHAFVEERTAPGAKVYTDEHPSYRRLRRAHETVDHSVGEYVRGGKGGAHTQGIESFWAMLKRAYKGTFHHISPKHLHRYVNEFAARHNMRPQDTIAMMEGTVARMDGKRLTYRSLIAGGPAYEAAPQQPARPPMAGAQMRFDWG